MNINLGLTTNKFSQDDSSLFATHLPAAYSVSEHVIRCLHTDFSDNILFDYKLKPSINIDFYRTFSLKNEKYFVIITFAVLANRHLEQNPFATLPADLLEDVRAGKAKIVLDHSHECFHISPSFRDMTFERLNSHINASKLPRTGIVLATEDVEYVKHYTDLHVVFRNIFIEYVQHHMFHSKRNNFENTIELADVDTRSIFLCLNFIAKEHRKEIAEHFLSLPNHGNSKVTFSGLEYDMETLHKNRFGAGPFYCKADLSKYPLLSQHAPLCLDLEIDGAECSDWLMSHRLGEALHKLAYFSVITESFPYTGFTGRKNNSLFTTEKTYKAIANGHAFLMVNTPYTLRHLRKLGFQTFSTIFDESYDLEEDDSTRIQMVKDEITRVCSMSMDQIKEMYKQIIPILEYNRKHLYETDWSFGLHDIFEQ